MKKFLLNYVFAFFSFFYIWNLMWANTWYYDFTEPVQYYLSSFEQLKVLNPLMVLIALGLTLLLAGFYTLLEISAFKVLYLFLVTLVLCELSMACGWTFTGFIFESQFSYHRLIKLFFLVGMGGFLFLIFKRYGEDMVSVFHKILVIFSPLAFFVTIALLWTILPLYHSPSDTLPPLPESSKKTRLLWIIFDEMDQRALFEQEASLQRYPHFHAFKNQALIATQAHAAGASTIIALPSLITGKELEKVKLLSHQQLLLTGSDQVASLWKEHEHLFSKAYAKGYRSAIKGFYHPYHRLFNRFLDQKKSFQFNFSHNDLWIIGRFILQKATEKSLALAKEFRRFLLKIPPRPRTARHNHLRSFSISQIEKTFKNFHHDVISLIKDPGLDFVFVHCPYPHLPAYYSLEQDRFSHDLSANYFGNLKMVDHFFGEICSELKKNQLWDETLLIVSSDHWFRESWSQLPFWYELDEAELALAKAPELRVPLLIKAIGQKDALTFNKPFNSLILHSLVLEIMDGKVQTALELHSWLEEHHERFKLDIPLKDFFIFN